MTVLSQTFFAFVCRHFMSFSFLSAWHNIIYLMLFNDEVLLFGPTNAKTELYNILKEDHHFDKIKIETAPSDKMTENQQYALLKEHFSK